MLAKILLLPILSVSFLITLSSQNVSYAATAPGLISSFAAAEPLELTDFHLITAETGWLLLGQQLYLTTDGGQSWVETTPSTPERTDIQAVWFVDPQTGWLVLTQPQAAGTIAYFIARTSDGGITWQLAPLSLFAPGDQSILPGAIYLHFVDIQTGWLVIKQATGSNFSVGALFKTTDGGQTWAQLPLPIGEPVYFVTRQLGWTAGGPAGDQLYRTQDGGQTWQAQTVGQAGLRPEQQATYQLPTFTDDRNGVLPVIIGEAINPQVNFYHTGDAGLSWSLVAMTSLGRDVTAGTVVPIGILDDWRWLLIVPQSKQLLRLSGDTPAVVSQSNWARGIVELDFVNPNTGWARYEVGRCANEPGQNGQMTISCRQETRLLHTLDGGQHWTPLNLPLPDNAKTNRDRVVVESVITSGQPQPAGAVSPQVLGGQIRIFSGHGFDKCEIASSSQLQNWIMNSPYRAVNLYIGGISRYCSNMALSASLMAQLSQQGWQFIPTWVGPQAACTGYTWRMSLDLATAYNEGIAEATAALDVAYNLGLTLDDKSGAIIYYDLEYFNYSNTACFDAAKAFIAGWTGYLRGAGSQAGVYSTGPILNGFDAIPNVPDAIWPAHWIYTSFDEGATVWDVYSLSNSLWNNQQRIRQYTGGHNETWDSVTLNIDSDVIEGVVVWQPQEELYLPVIIQE